MWDGGYRDGKVLRTERGRGGRIMHKDEYLEKKLLRSRMSIYIGEADLFLALGLDTWFASILFRLVTQGVC